MLINKSNYELFALDYIEGNLELRERKAMKAFLQAHPDLEAEIESMQAAMFTFEADEHIVYESKASLLKEEKGAAVIFMQPRNWYKMAAAAAVAILLIGFGVGYFAGSISSDEGGMMVETTPVIEEKVQPTTPTIEEQKVEERIANVRDSKPILPKSSTPKVKVKNDNKSLILQEPNDSKLATLESENIEPTKVKEIEIQPVIEELEEVERTAVIAITPLPKVEINIIINSIQSVPESSVITDHNAIVSLTADGRFSNKLSKIRGFIGKLPFEDATLDAFVPTYFANADSD
ncbi:MAG: hypothetical protein AAF806_00915 [Bacteroidota bacterium]